MDFYQQAQSHYRAGELRAAEQALQRLFGDGPPTLAALQLLARVAAAGGRGHLERQALEQCLALAPEDQGVWAQLAECLAYNGWLTQALQCWRRAARRFPAAPSLLAGWCRAALQVQNLAEADDAWARLAELAPSAPGTHKLRAALASARGQRNEAAAAYRAALQADVSDAEALYGLVELNAGAEDDAFAAQLLAPLASGNNSHPRASQAQFALALLSERRGAYDAAMEHWHRANGLALAERSERQPDYQPAHMEARVARAQTEFPAQTFAEALPDLPLQTQPLFILGLPRSGTTLVERILESHSRVASGGELELAQRCQLELQQARARGGRRGPVDVRDQGDRELLERLREQYLDGLFERAPAAPFVIDKMPANFMHAGLLRLLFPRAPIVHLLRDPRATCLSLYRANFGAHEAYYHSLSGLAHYQRQYQQLMAHWRRVLPAPFIEVRYERLVQEPEAMIRALLAALDLTFEPACLAPQASAMPVLTASHAQVRQPIHTASVAQWQRYGDALGPVAQLQPEPESPRELRP